MESKEVDELLRQAGYDPEVVGQQFSMYAQKCAEVLELRAENARLRDALQTISEMGNLVGVAESEFQAIADQALRGE